MFKFIKNIFKKPAPLTEADIVQKTLGGRVIGGFIPNSNFTCPVTNSIYVKGQFYNIRQGNKELINRVNDWVRSGKVTRVAQ